MDYLTQHAPQFLLSGIGLILAHYLRRAIKVFESLAETRVKSNWAFGDLCERKPEYARLYKEWADSRK
jgi:hypothetical protein